MKLITTYYHYCAYCKKGWSILEIVSVCKICNRVTMGGPMLNYVCE